jgi:hypothetical protein
MQFTFPQLSWLVLLGIIMIWCISHERAALGFAIYSIGSLLPLGLFWAYEKFRPSKA